MSEKICKCDWCVNWRPKVNRVEEALRAKPEAKDFDEIITKWLSDSEDRNCCQAKLDGQWPGWEWIVEEKKKRGLA